MIGISVIDIGIAPRGFLVDGEIKKNGKDLFKILLEKGKFELLLNIRKINDN